MRADEATTEKYIETVTLRLGQICHAQLFDDKRWPFAEEPKIDAQYMVEYCALMIRAMVRYVEQPCEPVTYPADWWQAVKQRFAPAWALKRWPVKLTVWEPFVIYPEIKLPHEKHYVQIRLREHIPSWSD